MQFIAITISTRASTHIIVVDDGEFSDSAFTTESWGWTSVTDSYMSDALYNTM